MEATVATDRALRPDIEAPGKAERSDDDYTIFAFKKGLAVLEALKGQEYEAVSVSEIQRRTKFDYDFCRRALKTLKVCGWAIEDERGWRLSVKAMQFSNDFLAFAASLPTNTIPKFRNRVD